MALKAILDTLEGVDEPFKTLYTEREGKFLLTGIEGVKTDADVARVTTALQAEKNAAKELKAQLASFTALGELPDLQSRLDRIAELEAAAGGKLDEAGIEKIAEARLKTRIAPVERELTKAQQIAAERQAVIDGFIQKEKSRAIHDAARSAAVASKVLAEATEDVLLLAERVLEVTDDGKVVTKDGVGVTPGLPAEAWLADMQSKRPHWWPASVGGGARGSNGGGTFSNNPFSGEHWNMTEQGKVLRENPARAEQMAKAAGTSIGGPRPATKG
jgi:hypothetical protein